MNVRFKWVTVFLLLQPAVVAIGGNTCGGSAATVVLNDSGFNAGAMFVLGVITGVAATFAYLSMQGAISSATAAAAPPSASSLLPSGALSVASAPPSSPASGSPLPSPRMPTRSVALSREDLTRRSVASQSQCTYSRNRAQPRFTPL